MTPDTPRTDNHMKLPDSSGCFTLTIMSQDEARALPLKQRPLNHRISGDMYHAVFEAIGEASTTWKTEMGNEVFNSYAAEKIAVDLCFKIANEAEKWRELSATEVCTGNPAIAGYVASLERELNALRWTPITERLPTIEDGNGLEDVEWSDGAGIWEGNYAKTWHRKKATHWRRITLP